MTSDRRFEQDIPDLLAQLAPRAEPVYRDAVVQQTARMRQRPAWTFPERWLPMDLALSPGRGRSRPFAAVAVLVLIALLIGAVLVAYVGSRPVPLPAPFGVAGNGALFFSSAQGDIMTVDSVTGTPRAIVTGPEVDTGPLPSRDGRRIAFTREATGGTEVVVADQDGANLHVLPGTYADLSEIDWSPTGDEIAIISNVAGVPSLTTLETDGSATKILLLGLEAHSFWYLPDGRIVFKGFDDDAIPATFGLYVVNSDGTGLRPITTPSPDDGRWIDPYPSPDGKSLVYHRWDPATGDLGLHIVDIASGNDRRLDLAMNAEDTNQTAQFSPDGTKVMFARFTADGMTLSVVPTSGGTPVDIGQKLTVNTIPFAYFAPDGRSVIAWYPSSQQLWELDPTGATPGRQLSLPVSDAPAYQRVATP